MAETLVVGRLVQLFVATETSYGVPPTLVATHAMRHINFKPSFSPFNRVNSPAKKVSPGVAMRLDRRASAGASLEALIQPSGTLNTLAECDPILEHAMGAKSNVTLATTVAASPAPTTTVFTVASATGLVVGQAILVACTGGTFPGKYVRWIAAINTLALTVTPALPQAPATGDAVKGCCTYKLTSAVASSLAFGHYRTADTTHSKIIKGAVCEKLGFSFAQNDEARLTATFKAKTQITPAPTKPAAFTTVGAQNPPSGLTGELYVGGAAYKFIKLDVEISTGVALRENSYGYSSAEGILMTGTRDITLGLDALVGDEAVIYDLAEAGTRVAIHKQTGFTEGNIIALYAPAVDFSVPEDDDPDGVPTWPFKGVCCETADGLNDELKFALA